MKAGRKIKNLSGDVENGVDILDKDFRSQMCFTHAEILKALDDYKEQLESDGIEWKLEDALSALQINPSWFFDEFTLSVIRMYFFYRKAPHEAYPVSFSEQPAIWVDSVISLNGIFGQVI